MSGDLLSYQGRRQAGSGTQGDLLSQRGRPAASLPLAAGPVHTPPAGDVLAHGAPPRAPQQPQRLAAAPPPGAAGGCVLGVPSGAAPAAMAPPPPAPQVAMAPAVHVPPARPTLAAAPAVAPVAMAPAVYVPPSRPTLAAAPAVAPAMAPAVYVPPSRPSLTTPRCSPGTASTPQAAGPRSGFVAASVSAPSSAQRAAVGFTASAAGLGASSGAASHASTRPFVTATQPADVLFGSGGAQAVARPGDLLAQAPTLAHWQPAASGTVPPPDRWHRRAAEPPESRTPVAGAREQEMNLLAGVLACLFLLACCLILGTHTVLWAI